MSDYRLLIDGTLVAGDLTMEVVNPATEEVLARCPRASEAQLNAAIAAARAAWPAWARRPIAERRRMILDWADRLQQGADRLARLLTQEQGKPLADSTPEMAYAVHFIRHLAALEMPVKVIEDSATRLVERYRRPLGVVGAIIPWNFPILLLAFKATLALLAGNSVVIKPAPTTPLTTLRVGEMMAASFPAGVVNIVTDAGNLGPKMTAHPDIAKFRFTGSSETGRKVMASAAETIKRITLELGGNDAAIVLPGADLDAVAPGISGAAFMSAGQVWIKKHLDFGPRITFGGAKQSGLRVELGEEGLAEFTQVHILNEAR